MNDLRDLEEFRPTKKLWIIAFFGALLLLAYDVSVLLNPKQMDRSLAFETIGFGVLGVIIAPLMLLPNCSFVRTDKNGLTIRVFWRTTFYRWVDIEQFGIAEIPTIHVHGFSRGGHTVGFKLSKSYLDKHRSKKMLRVNGRLIGFNGVLPETYGWRAAELADHLNRLRNRFQTAENE